MNSYLLEAKNRITAGYEEGDAIEGACHQRALLASTKRV
jgi:hypothetical protein